MSKKKTRHLLVARSTAQAQTLVVDKSTMLYRWGETAQAAIADLEVGHGVECPDFILEWAKNPNKVNQFVKVCVG